jgi:hypothetical protein
MVTDRQFRRLRKLLQTESTLANAADRAEVDEKTARKYRDSDSLPSQRRVPHTWRTREDPFQHVWPELLELLRLNPGLQAKTLFDDLQRPFPGRFPDVQLRCLQRRIKQWRALEGPPKEVFFAQIHEPGRLAESDFTCMAKLGVTILGEPFDHMVYHFVLTYSNWEAGTVCFSESFETLSEGLQNALWELGGVPRRHRTDRLTAAVNSDPQSEMFTRRYQGLLAYYQIEGQAIQPRQANENGDVEQSHHRFKQAVDQALMLRGSRDFASRGDYQTFLKKLMAGRNANRKERFREEMAVLSALPARRLEMARRLKARVDSGSTIHVGGNTYSLPSRLIGEQVDVHVGAETLDVWHGARKIDTLPRLRGRGRHRVDYRHVIDWLVRKPGAFEEYRYRDSMFPTSRFRMAYDLLKERRPGRVVKDYLALLLLATKEGECRVDEALRLLLETARVADVESVTEALGQGQRPPAVTDVIDDGGGDRPAGASLRDRGIERAELSSGAGQEGPSDSIGESTPPLLLERTDFLDGDAPAVAKVEAFLAQALATSGATHRPPPGRWYPGSATCSCPTTRSRRMAATSPISCGTCRPRASIRSR